jgi:hypothetical protein
VLTTTGKHESLSPPVTWEKIPAALRKLMLPPRAAIAYCITQASAQDGTSNEKALAGCIDLRLAAQTEVFLACHQLSSDAPGNLYFERRRKCLIELGAKIDG